MILGQGLQPNHRKVDSIKTNSKPVVVSTMLLHLFLLPSLVRGQCLDTTVASRHETYSQPFGYASEACLRLSLSGLSEIILVCLRAFSSYQYTDKHTAKQCMLATEPMGVAYFLVSGF